MILSLILIFFAALDADDNKTIYPRDQSWVRFNLAYYFPRQTASPMSSIIPCELYIIII